MDQNKHKFFMLQILRDVFSDAFLAQSVAFKGGTALMFFYDLPRFSVDLDFNILKKESEEQVYLKFIAVLQRYGNIIDKAKKFYGPVIVLDYGVGERKLKVELSNREYDNHYEIKSLLGINMRVMVKEDMFAHKLCALLDRPEMTGRDAFDCWFFLQSHTAISSTIVEERMQMPLNDYLSECIKQLEKTSDKTIMSGLGELTDAKMKDFARTKLRVELIQLLKMFQAFPSVNSERH